MPKRKVTLSFAGLMLVSTPSIGEYIGKTLLCTQEEIAYVSSSDKGFKSAKATINDGYKFMLSEKGLKGIDSDAWNMPLCKMYGDKVTCEDSNQLLNFLKLKDGTFTMSRVGLVREDEEKIDGDKVLVHSVAIGKCSIF